MKTVEYLDTVQRKFNLPSDYAISKQIGITRMAVSHYRAGKGFFSDDVAKKVAEVLGIHPGIVLLDMYAERTRDEETRCIWEEVQQGFQVPLRHAKTVQALRLPRS